MKRTTLNVLGGCLLALAWSSAAQAQATRTWISGVGDDANPCSRTAPCKTWQGAIPKTATGGEINALDPGGFGGVTITKSITLDGGPGIAGILVANVDGVTVNDAGAGTAVVTLRNLDINGLGAAMLTSPNGVSMVSGARLTVENCKIYGFATAGVHVQSGSAHLKGNTIINNRVGSGDASGILADGAGVVVTADDNQVANNDVGVQALNGATVRIAENAIYDNGTSLAGCGKTATDGIITTVGGNRIAGNGGGSVPACKLNGKIKQQ